MVYIMETSEIGERLAAERKRRKLTQARLAELIGTNPQSVSNWENDRSRPSTGDLQAMGLLGFNVSFILLGKGRVDRKLQATL